MKDYVMGIVTYLEAVVQFYGCQKCGTFCLIDAPMINQEDVTKISKYKRINKQSFLKKYCMHYSPPMVQTVTDIKLNTPCPFYKNKKCSIYHVRPIVCRTFPFTIRFSPDGSITYFVLEGINVCSIANLIQDEFIDFLEKTLNTKITIDYDKAEKEIIEINKYRKTLELPSLYPHTCGIEPRQFSQFIKSRINNTN